MLAYYLYALVHGDGGQVPDVVEGQVQLLQHGQRVDAVHLPKPAPVGSQHPQLPQTRPLKNDKERTNA